MAMVETTWGVVAARDVGAKTVDVFLYGSAYASEGFRIIAGTPPLVAASVRVAIDKARGDRWVIEPLVGIDGSTTIGSGTTAKEDGSTVVATATGFDFRHGLDVTASGTNAIVAIDESELTIPEASLSTADTTTANVSSTKHGFAPKSPADATKFLNGAATPAYANVKDSDLATTDVTSNNVGSTKHGFAPKSPADATQFLNGAATPAYAQVKDSDLSTSDVTTNNASITKHGFVPKLPNDATKYYDGVGGFSVPPSGSALTAKDEGSNLDTAVASIDFTGAGVTATSVGHAITVNVPGGGSGSTRPITVAKIYNSVAQSFPHAVTTQFNFDTAEFDPQGYKFGNGFKVPVGQGGVPFELSGGTFCITANVPYSDVILLYEVNGAGIIGGASTRVRSPNTGQAPGYFFLPSLIVNLNDGDVVTMHAYVDNDSGGGGVAMSLGYATAESWMTIKRLTVGGGMGFVGARVARATTQSIGNVTFTAFACDTEDFDTDGFHDNSTNNSRITIPAGLGGRYLVLGGIEWTGSTAGERILSLRVNGTDAGGWDRHVAGSTGEVGQNTSAVLTLTAGDYVELFAYQSSGGSLTLNPAGGVGRSSFTAIKLDGGSMGSGVGASAFNNGTQSVPNNTDTALTLDSEDFDTDGFHSTGSNTSRMTIPAGLGGKYLLTGRTRFAANATGFRQLYFYKNGATTLADTLAPITTGTNHDAEVTFIVSLAAGDYVELYAVQNSGGSLNVGNASSYVSTRFQIMRLESGGGSSGGSALTAKDEGSNLDTAVTSFDFTGAGVTATNTGHAITVNIPGGVAVNEVDGSPSDSAVTQLIFPNDSLQISGHVATIRQVPTGFIGCYVRGSSNQTLTTDTETAITMDGTEVFDTDGFHDSGTNPSRMTVPAGMAGKYLITATVAYATSGTNLRFAGIWKNGSGTGVSIRYTAANAGYHSTAQITAILDLVAGDYIQITGFQNTGGNLATVGNECEAEMVKLDSGRVGSAVGASVYNAGNATAGTGSYAAINIFDTEYFDTDGFHSTSSNTGRFTIPAGMGGTYIVNIVAYVGSGTNYLALALNGGVLAYDQFHGDMANISRVLKLNAGDYVEVYSNTASHTWFTGGCYFEIIRVDSSSNGPRFQGVRATSGGDTAVTNNTWTAIALSLETFDTNGYHDTSTNNSRITANSAGYFKVMGTFSWRNSTNTAIRYGVIYKNGTQISNSTGGERGNASDGVPSHVLVDIIQVVAGDYIELFAYQNTGGTLNVYGATLAVEFIPA